MLEGAAVDIGVDIAGRYVGLYFKSSFKCSTGFFRQYFKACCKSRDTFLLTFLKAVIVGRIIKPFI